MKNELRIFFTALMFYTRIPCPKWVDHNAEYLNKATRYLPLVGWIVGLISASVFGVAVRIFPVSVSLILSMVAGILVTGAFHEDGFADVCDGFGGGWTKQKILDIMKDSRTGAYGVIGALLILSLKFAALYTLAQQDVVFGCKVIFSAHAISRFAAIALRRNLDYVRENDNDGKAKPVARQTSAGDYFIAAFFGLLPLVLFKCWPVLEVLIPLFVVVLYLRYYFKKWIGGYTGDCLGATQQVSEVVFYLALIVLWKFI